jgi:hypothetical protein
VAATGLAILYVPKNLYTASVSVHQVSKLHRDPRMSRRRRTPVDRPLPGRRPKDGSRALARLYADTKIDGRTAPAKALRAVQTALLADFPVPADSVPASARLLIDRTALIAVQLMLRERKLLKDAAINDGAVVPDNEKFLVALLNTFTRNLQAIDAMRREIQTEPHGPTLAEYLSARRNGHADAAEQPHSIEAAGRKDKDSANAGQR